MSPDPIRVALETAYHAVVEDIKNGISSGDTLPTDIKQRIDSWSYGKMGWTSPVNLLVTAAWYKWQNKEQDVTMIWAKDDKKQIIPGGFSIRSADEGYTIKLLSKYGIYQNFCSPNSGMQGSRALEKSRSMKKINRDSSLSQSVSFNFQLFAEILNDINDFEDPEKIFKYFLEIAIKKSNSMKKALADISSAKGISFNKQRYLIENAVKRVDDPQFTRAIVAGIINIMISKGIGIFTDGKLENISGAKTAADARSKAPGDLWVSRDNRPVIGIEVKDKSKSFDFSSIGRAEERIHDNPSLKFYFFITGAADAFEGGVSNDLEFEKLRRKYQNSGRDFMVITIVDLINMLYIYCGEVELLEDINAMIKETKDLKNDTPEKWMSIIKTL